MHLKMTTGIVRGEWTGAEEAIDLRFDLPCIYFDIGIVRPFFTQDDKAILSEPGQDFPVFGATIGRMFLQWAMTFNKSVVQEDEVFGAGWLLPGSVAS
jgi:hypothetical protein